MLAYIFELGSPTLQESRTTEYPLIIASVCRLWRNIALRLAKIIWSSVTISISRPLQIPLLYIERSGESPLKLLFVATLFSPASARNEPLLLQTIDILHKYIHRCEVLKFVCIQRKFPVVMNSLNHARAPNLHTLTVDCVDNYYFPLPSIFEADGAPNLTSLALYHTPNMRPQTSLSSVTKLKLYRCGHSMTYSEMSLFLQSFRSLRQLTFIESGPSVVDDADQILIPDTGHISLPDLLALDFGFDHGSLEMFALQTPSLRTMKLSASAICTAVNTIPELLWSPRYPRPSVETFIISGALRIPSDIKDILQAFPNVKHLVFHQTWVESIAEFLISTIQKDGDWQSLETVTISPWSNHVGKFIDDILYPNGTYPSSTWRQLERIQLVTENLKMYAGLDDALKALAKRIEILPPHADPADISSIVRDLSRGDEASSRL